MKNVIYCTVHVLCALPTILLALISILIFISCYQYRWLCIVLPIACVTTFKLYHSYSNDVIDVLKLIEKIKKDFSN